MGVRYFNKLLGRRPARRRRVASEDFRVVGLAAE
jgi:hypothetical protein